MTSHEFDRAKVFGIGIPEEPTEENIGRVLSHLEMGVKANWSSGLCLFSDWPRWSDGYQPRFYVIKNRTV